jgi:1-deoxy-D-xylulose-5-phosphate reductoisomerase
MVVTPSITGRGTHAAPMFPARSVTILGSTGSVGVSTVALLLDHPGRWQVEALVANRNVERLVEQALRLRPAMVAVADEAAYPALKAALSGSGITVAAGASGVLEAARRPADWTMAAILGAAGLAPALAVVERGGTLALANKESLVCAGDVLMAAARRSGAMILPVDSEHSAIFQVLDNRQRGAVQRLILTASGGPFRLWSRERMAVATPAEACRHPNWSMGAKISVDSATMMNKGLELIEASYLFAMPEPMIDVMVHPQSVVHSMVEYADGSVLAQLGAPDMRTPIAVALAWPERLMAAGDRLDLLQTGPLSFEAPDVERFPALSLARQALRSGGLAPAVLNAANEEAVAAFLGGRIGFLDIERVTQETLEACARAADASAAITSLEAAYAADVKARCHAIAKIACLSR